MERTSGLQTGCVVVLNRSGEQFYAVLIIVAWSRNEIKRFSW